jgi:predicted nucleic acid-binding Zn ribbon protein
MAKRGTFPCPTCGEEVPAGARACPSCGADENTGWSEDARYDGLDLPDEEFEYGKFLEKEGLGKRKRSRREITLLVVALLVLLGFVLLYVLR